MRGTHEASLSRTSSTTDGGDKQPPGQNAPAPLLELDTEAALRQELDQVEKRREPPPSAAPDPSETAAARAARLKLSALCLSGGGIRSAAFCLGVIQTLGARKLLNQFDYLSTVSGGGFIGGWLQMLIHETGATKGSMADVEEQLGNGRAPALSRLRGYTNYLTPHNGILGTDTWAGIVLYLRNLIINWMIFTPAFMLLALSVIFYRSILFALSGSLGACAILLGIGAVCLVASTYNACVMLPSHRVEAYGSFCAGRQILFYIVAPALAWALLVPFWFIHVFDLIDTQGHLLRSAAPEWVLSPQYLVSGIYVVAMLAGYCLAWLWGGGSKRPAKDLYKINALQWLMATLVIAGLMAAGSQLLLPGHTLYRSVRYLLRQSGLVIDAPTLIAAALPLGLIVFHMLQTTFYVAFRREGVVADLDREWLARLSGSALRIGAAVTVLSICCLVIPALLIGHETDTAKQLKTLFTTGGTGVAIGGPAAWLGKKMASQIKALAAQSGQAVVWCLNGLSLAFAVCLMATAGALVEFGLGQIQTAVEGQYPWLGGSMTTPLLLQFALALLLSALLFTFGQVNVNRFSMQAVYRNRLVRAFLGTARGEQRCPDSFTGFDPRDNARLVDFNDISAKQRLFPVINMTLNVTSGSNTAWAERQAASFTATPLHCGAGALRSKNPAAGLEGVFIPTRNYAGQDSPADTDAAEKGPRLGSILTISGAAVSPNWGYHSSPLLAFVMTLFNARLGAWLPNPAHSTKQELSLSQPSNSLIAIFSELLGRTTDTRQAVYLSDGGHFDNLGLYEMLRRRCHHIVAVDAGQDEDCKLTDLGNAIRKARVDMGVDVQIATTHLVSRKRIEGNPELAAKALGFAIGTIDYPGGEPGVLIYLKPSFLTGIPADVLAFGLTHPSFPNVSTLEQNFSESEFESYRALGAWQMATLIGVMEEVTLDGLFAAVAPNG